MKTFELKMNRSRWISLLIVVLSVALIVMMLSPYFTYGKSSTLTKPAEGTKDMLFGRTWIKTGTAEGDENYEALVISKDGKNSTYVTTNKLRYNQQYTEKVFESAIENYRTMKNNLDAAVANEEAAWVKYYELGDMCNKLAATMGKDPFVLKDKAATEAAEEASGEGEGEAAESEATEAEAAEEETIVLAQEGDPFAEEFKTLTNSMKAADRAVDNAVKARNVAEDALEDAKKACEDAYQACVTAYDSKIEPDYALVKVDSSEYNNVLVESYPDDYVKALIENKDKDYKNWLVEHKDLYKSFADSLGITQNDISANVVSAILADSTKAGEFEEGFIKANEADFNNFVKDNGKAITDALYAELVTEVQISDYMAFGEQNSAAFKAYVNENRETLKTRLYEDISDTTRTRAAYLTALKNVLYRDFVAAECADEFKAFVLDGSRKQNIEDTLYSMYIESANSTLFDDLYNEFVTTQKAEQFKEYLTKLAIDGNDALEAKLEKIATDNKQELYQGNLKLMAQDYAEANIDAFREAMVASKVAADDTETRKNAEYKLYANSKAEQFNTWLNGKSYADSMKDDAYKAWITAKKVATKDKNNFYTNVFTKLSAEDQKKYNQEFFDLTESTLKDSDKDAIIKATKAAVLTRMSNEELDNAIYGELNDMITSSDAAYAKAAAADKLVTSSSKDGKASNTSGKAEKQVTQIQKQIDKVQPIFDEVEIIVAKEKVYNDLLKGDEAAKEEAFETFAEEKHDLFLQMVLKQEAADTKSELYNILTSAADTSIDSFSDTWNGRSAAYIEELLAKLESEAGENGDTKLDNLYSKFILEEHNAEFKDWLYERQQAETEEDEEEAATTTKSSSKADKITVNEVDAATFRSTFLDGKDDPKAMEEAAAKTSVSIETPVTVAYTAGKEANDPANLVLTFANGDVKKSEFDTVLSYDKVQKLSILGFIAFPDDYADDFEIPVANYKIQGYSRNSVVLLPILLFVLLIVCIVLAIIKRDSYVSGILPVATGIIGVLAFLFNTFLKLGDNPITFVICFAVLLVAGCLQICLYIRDKKKAA